MKTKVPRGNAGLWLAAVGAILLTVEDPALFSSPEIQESVARIEEIEKPKGDTDFKLDLSEEYQPDFEHPRTYRREEMENLAREVLAKVEKTLGAPFNREDPQHVWALAEFFGLSPVESLDPYSTPVDEGDIGYFSEFSTHQDQELYPQDATQLVIRFYWEGLARIAAARYKLEVVNDRWSPNPQKTRGKVSDVATTAMFDKRPGISVAEAIAQGKERYDLGRLMRHLKNKGLQRGN